MIISPTKRKEITFIIEGGVSVKKSFSEFFLMDTDDVRRYAVEILHRFAPDEETDCIEIGDGNINYVYKVFSKADGHSVIIKQADKLLRCSGRPLDLYRNKIEARILQLEAELAPGFVPEVFYYDEIMAATSMEDISAYKNLRHELMENRVYPHLAENISEFLASTLLPTTDLVMDAGKKKQNVKFFINPELCFITEDLVLSEPYLAVPFFERNKNIITPGNEIFVEEQLYNNNSLHTQIASLRNSFMNNAQALIHGDLHTGSIFANERGIKVLDPEFAFYGPMGYDIGNVIGNLFFSLGNKAFTMPNETVAISQLKEAIRDVFDLTRKKLFEKYDAMVSFPLYKNIAFKKQYIDSIMADSVGYAGTEMIRRTVGDSKVMEITSVTNMAKRIPMERVLIETGIHFVMNHRKIIHGCELTDIFCRELDKI
ncbi:MAG: S-methyl-5-thioribose kinase [Oscillospiraceae bacterium]|nr:S-methyl-5-thioribose kinase [Oscillospiraceae bacterium]